MTMPPRAREREPDVFALLDADPSWTVVGWRHSDRLVACACLERASAKTWAIRSIGARDDSDARALLDAIARVSTASRLIADHRPTVRRPVRDQCAVTALLVRELLDGGILVANVLTGGRRVERHALNRLSSGLTLDLTREQLVNGEPLASLSSRSRCSRTATPERYATLRSRVRARLGSSQAASGSMRRSSRSSKWRRNSSPEGLSA